MQYVLPQHTNAYAFPLFCGRVAFCVFKYEFESEKKKKQKIIN